MKTKPVKYGFTLAEVLVASAIIVTIVSVVYGSYFATSKSARILRDRMAGSEQRRKTLTQIVRQLRCAYIPPQDMLHCPNQDVSPQTELFSRHAVTYFYGNPDDAAGLILAAVTTGSDSSGVNEPVGLYEVAYKFDKRSGILSFSRRRFTGASAGTETKDAWHTLAENISKLDLAFFDGTRWLQNWDARKLCSLPAAVKIGITYKDNENREYRDETVAYVCCARILNSESQASLLAGK